MEHRAFVFIEHDGETVPAGRLVITEDGRWSKSVFDYGRGYLQRSGSVALDPVQLPLEARQIETPADFILFNSLRDAAPDAWGRKLIDIHMMRTRRRPAMEAEYLLLSQRSTRPGALRFGPTSAAPGSVLGIELPEASSDPGTLEAFLELVALHEAGSEIPDSVLDHIAPGTSLGGARPKATIEVDGFPWLAKFPSSGDRIDMIAAEAGCLDLCEMAGLRVPERRVISVSGRAVLLLKRFDRIMDERGTLQRIHMISSLTLLGRHEMDRAMSGYADIHDAVSRHGVASDAGEEIFRRMLMNVLLGNTDDHYRNHAFLLDRNGRYRMSPVYDITPSLQVSPDRRLFMHLGKAGSGRRATVGTAVRAGPGLGVARDDAARIAGELREMVAANWERVMTDRGASAHDIDMMRRSFSEAGSRPDMETLDRPPDPEPDC